MNVSEYKEYGWRDDLPKSYHSHLIKRIIKSLQTDGSAILDIGCGNGFLVNYLVENGYNAYGIDASDEGVAIARRKNPDRFFVNNVTTGELPQELKGIRFKTVISTEVIEHLYSPKSYISFVNKVLTESGGGTFIVSTPYHGYLKNLAVAVSNRYDYHYSALWEGGHIKFWSRATLTKLLIDNGFHNIKFQGSGHAPFLWKIMVLEAQI